MASISDRTSEEALLRARVEDACRLCELRSCPRFVGFLDEHRQAVARAVLHEMGQTSFLFFGGAEGVGRTCLGVFPSFIEPSEEAFPIVPVGFRYRASATLDHRDFLGALLSLGVKRETLGDILCGKGETVVFALSEVAPYLAENVKKVGNEGISVVFPYSRRESNPDRFLTGAFPPARVIGGNHTTVCLPPLPCRTKKRLDKNCAHRSAKNF